MEFITNVKTSIYLGLVCRGSLLELNPTGLRQYAEVRTEM